MNIPRLKWAATILKRFFVARPVGYVLCIAILAFGVYVIFSLCSELRTPNYNFHGTHYDFIAFYSAGKTVLNHNIAQLYDAPSLTALQRQIIPHPIGAAGYMPFLNPPFMGVLLAPLALMNINTARLVWLTLSIIFAIFIIVSLVSPLRPRQKLLAVTLLLCTFPLYQTLVEGQVSILVLLSACVSYLYFKRGHKFLSGASLVLLWVLPQFGIFAAVGLVVKKQWQMLKGWLLSTLVILLITLPITGIKVYIAYIKLLANTTGNHFIDLSTSAKLTWRGALNMSSGLNGFFDSLIGLGHIGLVNGLYIITSLAFVGLLFYFMRKTGNMWTIKQEALFYSAAILISCIINPHLYAQDIIIIYMLIPALFILYKRHEINAILYFVGLCNLVFLDQYSRLHFFTLIIAVVTVRYILTTQKKKQLQVE